MVKASPWLSYPVAVLSHVALEQSTPMWIRSVDKHPGAKMKTTGGHYSQGAGKNLFFEAAAGSTASTATC